MVKLDKKPSRKGIQKPSSCREPIQCPHVHFRHDVPDRRGIARDKLTNILATPKGYWWEDVKREEDDKEKSPAKKTPTSPRRAHCKKYTKRYDRAYIHNFLAEVWAFLCPEMADRLKVMLMNEFSMSEKDANDFIFKQREDNILNSSTVSLYKKPRDIGDGKTVLDSVIKLRTPNKTYCDKFPKSPIGIRNSWIKNLSGLISEKMADYVLDTMTVDRTERQQEIAQTLMNRFNTMLEQKASLSKPKTQTHKTMALVADRLSLWLDKNVPMSKENAERLKDIEEAEEEKKKGGDWKKRLEEKKRKREEKKRPTKSKMKKQLEDELLEEEEGKGQPLSSTDISGKGEGDSGMEEGEEGDESELEDGEEGDESELEEGDQSPGDQPKPPPTDSSAEGIGDQGGEDGGQLKPGEQGGEDGGQLKPEGEEGAQSGKVDGEPQSGDEEAQGEDDGAPPSEGVPESPQDDVQPESGEGVQSGEDGGALPPSDTTDGDGPPKDEGERGEDDTLKSEADDGTKTTPPETEPPSSMEDTTEGKGQSEKTDDGLPGNEAVPSGASEAGGESELEEDGGQPSSAEQQPTTDDEDESKKQGDAQPTETGDAEVDGVPKQEGGDEPGGDSSATPASAPQQGAIVDDGSKSRPEGVTAEESKPSPEEMRQRELIKSIASLIADTPIEETPRQEAVKDVLGKQLEKEVGDEDPGTTSRVASKVATWIDKMVDQVETEYGDRNVKSLDRMGSVPQASSVSGGKLPPVSQKPKGSIFVVKKVDDREGYDVDLISNTRAHEKIRLARGGHLPKVEVPNPDAALEPTDVKKWVEWASTVSEMAQSWAEWIEDTVQEAQKRGEMLRKDDSPEKRKEWDVFRGKKARGAQQWRKTKKEVDRSAELWNQKGMKTRELKKPAQS